MSDLRARLRRLAAPLVRAFADQVVELLAQQAEQGLEAARELATSALASALDVRGVGEAPPATPVSEPAVAAVQGSTSRARHCRKCGAEGFTARGCGRTHNTSAAPVSDPAPVITTPAPPPSEPPPQSASRRAEIEASAARRDAARRAREQRAASFVRPRVGPARGAGGPVLPDVAPEGGAVGLPTPSATFEF